MLEAWVLRDDMLRIRNNRLTQEHRLEVDFKNCIGKKMSITVFVFVFCLYVCLFVCLFVCFSLNTNNGEGHDLVV